MQQYTYWLLAVGNYFYSSALADIPGVTFVGLGSGDTACRLIGVVFLSQEQTQDLVQLKFD